MSEPSRKGELEATQQTVRFFEPLLRASADGILVTDAAQNIVVVNEVFCAFFGRRWPDVAETNLFIWLQQLDAGAPQRWAELEKRVHSERKCGDVEFQMTTKDVVRCLSVNASLLEPVADEESGVIISIWRDITEHKWAERELRETEQRFRMLFETIPHGIAEIDTSGNIIASNHAHHRMLGYSDGELIGTTIADIVPEKDRDRVMLELRANVSKQLEPAPYEARHITKAGCVIDCEVAWDYRRNSLGELLGFACAVTDVTERKQAEKRRERLVHDLGERVKELDCLYGIAKSVREGRTLEEVLLEVAALIPAGWQYPEIARGKVRFDGKEYTSEPFQDTPWKLSGDIVIGDEQRGVIELYYLEERPVVDEGPFLKEERHLVDGIARAVSEAIERKRAEEALRVSHRFLEIANRHTQMIPLLREFVAEVRDLAGCQAVGIRMLDEEGNIPYQAYEGFSREFYDLESPLSLKSDRCMCINVIAGDVDPKLPFYTEGSSFYMNATTRFLATVSEEEKGQTRNACNKFGYESVALIPIRAEKRILGLIHVADPRENMVPLTMVEVLQKAAMQLGAAIERIWAEAALRKAHAELERRVEERTADLRAANRRLEAEVAERMQAEEALRRRDAILEAVSFAAERFLKLTDWQMGVSEALERLGRAAEVSRLYIFENHADDDGALLTSQRYEWTVPSVEPRTGNPELQGFPWRAGGFARWEGALGGRQIIHGHVREFPASEQEVLVPQQIKSIVAVPIFVEQRWWGFMGSDECMAEREWTKAEIEAIKTAAGVLGSAIQHQRDAEETQRHQAELVHAARLSTVGELAAGLAHELNTPLTAAINYVAGCARMLRSGSWHSEKLIEGMDKASAQALRAGEVFRRLGGFVRKQEPRRSSVDLNAAIREIIVLCEYPVREHGVTVRLELADQLPLVQADKVQLEQVILNLVRNSAEAISAAESAKREVIIRTSQPGGKAVEVEVQDTGPGLSAEARQRIFEAFFSTKPDGMGMGLAICRSIIEAHGGRIWVLPNTDPGAAFRFALPTCSGGDNDES